MYDTLVSVLSSVLAGGAAGGITARVVFRRSERNSRNATTARAGRDAYAANGDQSVWHGDDNRGRGDYTSNDNSWHGGSGNFIGNDNRGRRDRRRR